MPDLLSIQGLRAGYGEAVVLPDMSLALADGQVLALLGRNGTGKTTLARYFAEHVDGQVQFAAFTGKAAQVLRSK
uniref:ATP-binding cassette domain-containing protein n=1 Tax=Klebsiella aerogenes TaxID=548 RepID=UPI001952DED0